MHPIFGNRTARVLRKIDNALWERRLRILTRGTYRKEGAAQSMPAEQHYYATVPYRAIFRILTFLSLKPSDVFVDLGCGKGRVICCAATYDIAEAIGIEYVESLCDSARHNAQRVRRKKAPISILCSRAEEFDFTRGNLFYLFNPFGPETMKRVLDGLREGISARTRAVTVIYVNPVHEDLLAGTPWLRCYARLPDPDLSEFRATSLWISY